MLGISVQEGFQEMLQSEIEFKQSYPSRVELS